MVDSSHIPHLMIPLTQDDIHYVSILVGGLPLLTRNILTARQAGFVAITLILEDDAVLPDGMVSDNEARIVSATRMVTDNIHGRLLILSPQLLFWPEFFQCARQMRDSKAYIFGMQCAAVLADIEQSSVLATAVQQTESSTQILERVLLSLGNPAKAESSDFMPVRHSDDVREAEKRLFVRLVKKTDGYLARRINRRISLVVTQRLMNTSITPNQMTLLSTTIGLVAALCFLSPAYTIQLAGACLFLLHSILDGCDGELARLKFMSSRLGGILDFWSDNLVHIAVFACMGIGWGLASGAFFPFALAVGAAGGTVMSAAVVYAHSMCDSKESEPLYTSVSTSAKKTRLARLADALSRRDFIYLVLLLALFGKTQWFVIAAGIGAPIFAVLLVAIARMDSRQETRIKMPKPDKTCP